MGRIGKKLDIDFVISTGDNFYKQGLKGVDDPFFKKSFTNIYTSKSLSKPWYTVLGNHDYLGDVEAQLSPALRRRDKRWICKRNYVVGAGFWDIVFVDTNPLVQKYFNNPKNETFDWRNVLPRDKYISYVVKNLDLALQKSKARWKVVVGHHTIRSNGYHGDTQEIVDQILPILKRLQALDFSNSGDFEVCSNDYQFPRLDEVSWDLRLVFERADITTPAELTVLTLNTNRMRREGDSSAFLSTQTTHPWVCPPQIMNQVPEVLWRFDQAFAAEGGGEDEDMVFAPGGPPKIDPRVDIVHLVPEVALLPEGVPLNVGADRVRSKTLPPR
ncbi:hypothetical protein ACS0TY_025219 [Phlomoides rotata]